MRNFKRSIIADCQYIYLPDYTIHLLLLHKATNLSSKMGNNFASDFKAKHPEEIGADGVIKVCIGGGAGFIGSHIAKRLMAEVQQTLV